MSRRVRALACVAHVAHIAGWALLVGSLGVARAQEFPPPPPPEVPAAAPVMPSPVPARVDVEVMLILASEEPGREDPRLAPLMPTLRTTPFQSFTLVEQRAVRVADGERQDVALTEGRLLTVELLSHDTQQARVRLVLVSGQARLVDTVVSVHRGRSFFLAVRGQQGRSLIVPVSVRY